jgi:transposase
MSLEAIGKRAGKHESTVSYWLKKYGLEAARAEKHAAKGAPSKEEMEQLLAVGMSLREIGHRLDRSLASVRHWMGKYQLKPAPRRKRGSEHGRREMPSRCRRHGTTMFVREGSGYYRCKRCRVERVAQRRRSSSGSWWQRPAVNASSVDTAGASVPSSSITWIRARRSSTSALPVRPVPWRKREQRRVSASCFAPTATRRSRQASPLYR